MATTTAYTAYTAYTTVVVDPEDHIHCNRFDTINLISSKCYLFVLLLLLD